MSLLVLVDGEPMPEAEGRAFWTRFSDWMEEHRGDLAGFAAKEGFASVHPATKDGKPVLLVSRTEAQRPYANAAPAPDRSGGSNARHRPSGRGSGDRKNRRDFPRK